MTNFMELVLLFSLLQNTPRSIAIFDSILSIFGKDVADNLFLMATLADADIPPVLEATKQLIFHSENGLSSTIVALFASNMLSEATFNSKWVIQFFQLHHLKTFSRSLTLTRKELNEREQLETLIPGLQDQGLSHLEAMQQEGEILKQHRVINSNTDFTFQIEVPTFQKIPQHNNYDYLPQLHVYLPQELRIYVRQMMTSLNAMQ